MNRLAICFFPALLACQVDLIVGDIPTDAGPSNIDLGTVDLGPTDMGVQDLGPADFGPADTGVQDAEATPYTMMVHPTPNIMCGDGLAGSEPAFSGMSAADINLFSGMVTLTPGQDMFILTGDPLLPAFETRTLFLREGLMPGQPKNVFLGIAQLTPSPGPLSTTAQVGALFLDMSLPTLQGAAGVEYFDQFNTGSCFVSFLIELQ